MRVSAHRGPRQRVRAHQEQARRLGPRDGVRAHRARELQLRRQGPGGAAGGVRRRRRVRRRGQVQSLLQDIHIPAVFVSKMAGETLKKSARGEDGECCINSSMDETAGTVLVMSFVSLVVIISVLASFLFARNCRLLRHGVDNRPLYIKKHVLEKLPRSVYKSPCSSGNNSEEACAICLEDYDNGDMLRLLPCKHEFHVACIDPWLTKWGTFCPVCKLEVITSE